MNLVSSCPEFHVARVVAGQSRHVAVVAGTVQLHDQTLSSPETVNFDSLNHGVAERHRQAVPSAKIQELFLQANIGVRQLGVPARQHPSQLSPSLPAPATFQRLVERVQVNDSQPFAFGKSGFELTLTRGRGEVQICPCETRHGDSIFDGEVRLMLQTRSMDHKISIS